MASSFVAFIDEAGDDGFKFKENNEGSTRWLVLSAVVCRRENVHFAFEALKAAKATLGMDPKAVFHFQKMRHEHRNVLVRSFVGKPFRTISVLSYKPDIPSPERFQANKDMLYRYLSRLLIERLSWCCRDAYRPSQGGDGKVELIFSNRSSMSYQELRDYINHLMAQDANGSSVKIHWPAFSADLVRSVPHNQMAGLQLADAVATSLYFGVNLSRFNVNDPSYLSLLRPHAYRHQNKFLGYGVKFLSDFEALKKQMPHLGAAFENW